MQIYKPVKLHDRAVECTDCQGEVESVDFPVYIRCSQHTIKLPDRLQ